MFGKIKHIDKILSTSIIDGLGRANIEIDELKEAIKHIEKEQKALIIINEKILEGLTYMTKVFSQELSPSSGLDEFLYEKEKQEEQQQIVKGKKKKPKYDEYLNDLLIETMKT